MSAGLESRTLTVNEIVAALEKVESNGNPHAIGDNGKALGILQIHEIMVRDYNRIYKTNYKHCDAFDPVISRKICAGILNHYGQVIFVSTGQLPNAKQLAFVWNGGGMAWQRVGNPRHDEKQKHLEEYWRKLRRHITH